MKHTAIRSAPLLEILQEMAPESSKNTLRSWLQSGRVTIDNKPMERAQIQVLVGQEVCVGPKVSFIKGSLKILYEDDHMVVLEKPEGLLSVATAKENRATVHAMLKKQFHHPRVYPVHRLDRETSGVMLFAYHENARDALKKQFEQQNVDKTYFALVENEMSPQSGIWESYVEEDDFFYVKSTNNSIKGKLAITHFQVLQSKRNCSLLRLNPKTGRKNQIRVHCSEAGHPILGDKKYGATWT